MVRQEYLALSDSGLEEWLENESKKLEGDPISTEPVQYAIMDKTISSGQEYLKTVTMAPLNSNKTEEEPFEIMMDRQEYLALSDSELEKWLENESKQLEGDPLSTEPVQYAIMDTTISSGQEYFALFAQDAGHGEFLEDFNHNLEDDAVELSVSPSAQAKQQKVSSTKQSPRKKRSEVKPCRYAPATRSTKRSAIEQSCRKSALDKLGTSRCSLGDAPSGENQPPKRFEIPEDLKAGCKTERAFRDLSGFYDRLNELNWYKAVYGDCDVPQSYLKLGSWYVFSRR